MINLNKNQKLIILIVGLIILFVISFYIFQKVQDSKYEESMQEELLEGNAVVEEVKKEETGENYIIVHIAGSIKNGGIITAKEGSRVSDIINLAGGLSENSDISKVNLAYKVEDGQKIYIPSMEDKNVVDHYITFESGEGIIEQGNSEKQEIVNINTATQTELETLSGVGPSTALNIIKYREENGKYSSIEDIKNVPGIGESKFEQLKDSIKVK